MSRLFFIFFNINISDNSKEVHMFEDIITQPKETTTKNVPVKEIKSETKPRIRINLAPKPASLSEQVKGLEDLRQLIQILEITKNKVRRLKTKQKKNRKEQRKKKWES